MTSSATVPWRVQAARCALLVIDMQNDFVREGAPMEVPAARAAMPAMRRLLAGCRGLGVPAVFTRHLLYGTFDVSPLELAYQPRLREAGLRAGSDGVEVVAELAPRPGEVVIDRHRYDAFHGTPLATVLRNLRAPGRVDTVVISGTVTNICCESTARSAFMHDYKVAFVEDATAALTEEAHRATLSTIAQAFGRVLTVDALLAELRAPG